MTTYNYPYQKEIDDLTDRIYKTIDDDNLELYNQLRLERQLFINSHLPQLFEDDIKKMNLEELNKYSDLLGIILNTDNQTILNTYYPLAAKVSRLINEKNKEKELKQQQERDNYNSILSKVPEYQLKQLGISPEIAAFLINNGIDLDNISPELNPLLEPIKNVYDNNHFESTIVNYMKREECQLQRVPISLLAGTRLPTSNNNYYTLLQLLSYLYNNQSSYGERATKYLSNSIDENFKKIQESGNDISLMKIGDKYYVGQNGNHRCFYLLLSYLVEKQKYKNNPEMLEQLEEKYKVTAKVRSISKSNVLNTIRYIIEEAGVYEFKLLFNNEPQIIAIATIFGKEIQIRTEDQLVELFKEYILTLDENSLEYIKIMQIASTKELPIKINLLQNDLSLTSETMTK